MPSKSEVVGTLRSLAYFLESIKESSGRSPRTGLTIIRAKVWLTLGEADAVAELRRQLTPYAGRLAVGGMSTFFFGRIAHTVGELALADGTARPFGGGQGQEASSGWG